MDGHALTETRPMAPPALPLALRERAGLIHSEMEDAASLDAFRSLRTRLTLPVPTLRPVTLVCGIARGAGASFVARNLATAIALEPDRSAILMDCNLRSPSAHQGLLPDPSDGLVDFLQKPAIGVARIIHSTGVPRLFLMPASREPPPTGEWVSGFRFRALMDTLRSRHADRLIVLDGPPATTPDARILADLVDAILLVAARGRHTAAAVQDAATRFPPAKLAGVVFNHLP